MILLVERNYLLLLYVCIFIFHSTLGIFSAEMQITRNYCTAKHENFAYILILRNVVSWTIREIKMHTKILTLIGKH